MVYSGRWVRRSRLARDPYLSRLFKSNRTTSTRRSATTYRLCLHLTLSIHSTNFHSPTFSANRNSEPGDSTSSGYQSLKSSNETRSTEMSDASARRVNRRRAARLLLQKSIIDRLHYSHTSRSTSRSTDDKLNCRRCWRHASPSHHSSGSYSNRCLNYCIFYIKEFIEYRACLPTLSFCTFTISLWGKLEPKCHIERSSDSTSA